MSMGVVFLIACAVLTAAALVFACVSEFFARRLAKDARCDKKRLETLYGRADGGNVAAWCLLAVTYLLMRRGSLIPAAYEASANAAFSWLLGALAVLAVAFLVLRGSRAAEYRGRKQFWERR